eukprot:TRINITY_DN12155_c0_g5_i1.p1 TRINITY_DN12155_c0_g5~~TRINITY_DN12155_c0_g5_i1.p1  ORF type:complete len:272 (+),score=33.84 TRINITY_DN12155_c0_g5_i1:92-907(+)
MKEKIRTAIDLKYFTRHARIAEDLTANGFKGKYTYKLVHGSAHYILKGVKIPSLNKPENTAKFTRVFQEYYFMKAACRFSPHILQPLCLDYAVKVKNEEPCGYIEVLFRCEGVALNNMKTVSFSLAYSMMRQSASVLLLLASLGVTFLNMNPNSMVYDEVRDVLKLSDVESAFSYCIWKKYTATTLRLDEDSLLALEYAPPEILRLAKLPGTAPSLELSLNSIDVYFWAMTFYSVLSHKEPFELRREGEKYKLGLEAVSYTHLTLPTICSV